MDVYRRTTTMLPLSLILLSTISFAGASDRKNCPDVVQRSKHHIAVHGDSCYMFVSHEKFWDNARTYCWGKGGEMATVKNVETMKFIKKELYSTKLGWRSNGVWTGASNLREKGWEWTTGEPLTYSYWAEGEPSKFLGFLSLENCACMRRGDDWRWHDYHCHMDFYEYRFICEFPVVKPAVKTHVDYQSSDRASMKVREDTGMLVGIVIGGVALVLLLGTASYCLYRKHERQKAEVIGRPTIMFRNHNYMTVVHDSSHDNNSSTSDLRTVVNNDLRPTSNIYIDPDEVNRIYEEVTKDTNHGVNVNHSRGDTGECARLLYTGAAASVDNMDDGYMVSVSTSSRSTSANNSLTNVKADDGHYMEMNAAAGVDSGNWCSGATGSSSDLVHNGPPRENKYMNGSEENTQSLNGDGASQNSSDNSVNDIANSEKPNDSNSEQSLGNAYNALPAKQQDVEPVDHVYKNGTVGRTDLNSRPLPPLPKPEDVNNGANCR